MSNSEIQGFYYKVLSYVYRFTEKGEKPLIAHKFANIVGIDRAKLYAALRYLDERSLVNFDDGAIWMTPRGVAELARAVTPTFPNSVVNNTTNIHGDNSGKVQTGGDENEQ